MFCVFKKMHDLTFTLSFILFLGFLFVSESKRKKSSTTKGATELEDTSNIIVDEFPFSYNMDAGYGYFCR